MGKDAQERFHIQNLKETPCHKPECRDIHFIVPLECGKCKAVTHPRRKCSGLKTPQTAEDNRKNKTNVWLCPKHKTENSSSSEMVDEDKLEGGKSSQEDSSISAVVHQTIKTKQCSTERPMHYESDSETESNTQEKKTFEKPADDVPIKLNNEQANSKELEDNRLKRSICEKGELDHICNKENGGMDHSMTSDNPASQDS